MAGRTFLLNYVYFGLRVSFFYCEKDWGIFVVDEMVIRMVDMEARTCGLLIYLVAELGGLVIVFVNFLRWGFVSIDCVCFKVSDGCS